MEKIKNYIIHRLGGITLQEQRDSNDYCYQQGRRSTFRFIKAIADVNYGKDWRDEMYRLVCKHLNLLEEE